MNFKIHGTFKTVHKLSANEFLMNYRGLVTIEFDKEIIYAELAHILSKGLMYGKRRVRLSEDFIFYYPSEKMKARITLGTNDCSERVDGLSGGIYST